MSPPSAPTLLDLRAAQRTFEGAYLRTALGQFSFALVILKIFSRDFYAIGAVYAVFGAAVLLIAAWRRRAGNRVLLGSRGGEQEEGGEAEKVFRTSGGVVAAMGAVAVGVYAVLGWLVWRL